jgi:hypothetical protein
MNVETQAYENSSLNIKGRLTLKGDMIRMYSSFKEGRYFLSVRPGATRKQNLQQWYPDVRVEESEEIWCLTIAKSQAPFTFHWLCLKPTSEEKGEFQRIGICDWRIGTGDFASTPTVKQKGENGQTRLSGAVAQVGDFAEVSFQQKTICII